METLRKASTLIMWADSTVRVTPIAPAAIFHPPNAVPASYPPKTKTSATRVSALRAVSGINKINLVPPAPQTAKYVAPNKNVKYAHKATISSKWSALRSTNAPRHAILPILKTTILCDASNVVMRIKFCMTICASMIVPRQEWSRSLILFWDRKNVSHVLPNVKPVIPNFCAPHAIKIVL